jgi:Zn-dependent alcohol dehydrogenase
MPVGSFPAVLGHEGAGIVRQVGSGVKAASLKPGDAVMLSFRTCQSCEACKAGRCGACPLMTEMNFVRSRRDTSARPPFSLPDGKAVHGQFFGQSSFSKMAIVAEQSVTKCDVTIEEMRYLAPLGCGYLTGAGTVLNALKPSHNSKIAVLGVGAVGMAAVMAAKVVGVSEIIAVDIFDAKLDLARSIGATQTVNTKQFPDFVGKIRETFQDGVDYVLDTTGNAGLLGSSIGILAHEGTLALVGAPRPGSKFEVDALDLLTTCKRIIGVIEGYSDPKKVCTLRELFEAQADFSSWFLNLCSYTGQESFQWTVSQRFILQIPLIKPSRI